VSFALPLVVAGVKSNTTKLGGQLVLAAPKLDFLLLIVQLVVHHEDICSWATSTRVDRPNFFLIYTIVFGIS
jgi:hypothetical protein